MKNRILKLGTRRSLLAWAQSTWVARETERLNPGVQVELVGIDTKGDRIQDVPLSQVSGKEFFVAEIDEALRSGAVDMTVHSMKDLSLDRPAEFVLAAAPRRENPRDVIVFGPRILERLCSGEKLKIGTSSPRRLENIPPFLKRVLPRLAPKLTDEGEGASGVAFVEIRGNVNTRLARVHEAEGSARRLDGVVLAFAGLIRLWNDEKARVELRQLLEGCRWMILPLRECPAAPAQGALAIECRASDGEARDAINKLHDDATQMQVLRERQLLADWGGGCHQRFGATARTLPELRDVLYVRGAKPDGTFVDELQWEAPAKNTTPMRAWDGMKSRGLSQAARSLATAEVDWRGAYFIAHWRAVQGELAAQAAISRTARIWASGVKSWEKLAEMGFWVEGCAEGLGFENLRKTLLEPVLGLPLEERAWTVLTHDDALSGWSGQRLIPTYHVPALENADALSDLGQATHIFWGSSAQFEKLSDRARPDAHHACGPGKTAAHLRARGVSNLNVFPSVEEWRSWIRL